MEQGIAAEGDGVLGRAPTRMHIQGSIKGFTIVELLIVIVVIAILAAVTAVAYSGIQQNATNAKTTAALSAWVKAITMYKNEKGGWPGGAWTCLGEGYAYGQNAEATGVGQCRGTNAVGYNEQPAFNTLLRSYLGDGSLPTPSFVTAFNGTNEWRRGIHYAHGGGGDGTEVYIHAAYKGALDECPTPIPSNGRWVWGGNTVCVYQLGRTTDT